MLFFIALYPMPSVGGSSDYSSFAGKLRYHGDRTQWFRAWVGSCGIDKIVACSAAEEVV